MWFSDQEIVKTPFAVVDVETTGLSPIHDRIVEIAVVLVRLGEEPQVVLDTLVDPGRPMAGSEIHGISDEEVAGAPTFRDLAPPLIAALANRVVASHNVYFDVSMLVAELDRAGFTLEFPHVCTMLLPRVVDLAFPRMNLAQACEQCCQVKLADAHSAAGDALGAARLLDHHLKLLRKRGVRTFADLRKTAGDSYRFVQSLELAPLAPPPILARGKNLKPRIPRAQTARKAGVAQYLEAVLDAAADLSLGGDEIANLLSMREALGLSAAEVRAVHAKVYWGMISRFVEDARVDPTEVTLLHRLPALLSELGWAPGDPLP